MSARSGAVALGLKPDAKEQRQSIEAIDKIPALRAKYQQALKEVNSGMSHALSRWLTVGKILTEVQDAAKYGDSAVSVMIAALGIDHSSSYHAMRLLAEYTPAQLKEFLTRKNVNGNTIGFRFLVEAFRAKTQTQRLEYVEQFYRRALSVGSLMKELKGEADSALGPRGIVGRFSQISSMAQAFLSKLGDEFQASVLDKFDSDDESSADPRTLAAMELAVQCLNDLDVMVETRLGELTRIKVDIQRRLPAPATTESAAVDLTPAVAAPDESPAPATPKATSGKQRARRPQRSASGRPVADAAQRTRRPER